MKITSKMRAYMTGRKALKSKLKWVDNPYKAGSIEWVAWNDGKLDSLEKLTTEEWYKYLDTLL